jgi:hypothetical protein
MRQFAKAILCASVISMLSAAPAHANLVGPGNPTGGYIGAVKTVVVNVAGYGMSYSVHPTYNGCASGLTNIVNTFAANPSIYIVQVIPCHYVAGTSTPVEIDPGPMSPERIHGALHSEQELRDRYQVESYERELQGLWQSVDDGSH